MAPLTADRIVLAPPFSNFGLDFAGPLYLKNNCEKVYICLYMRGDRRSAPRINKQHDD